MLTVIGPGYKDFIGEGNRKSELGHAGVSIGMFSFVHTCTWGMG